MKVLEITGEPILHGGQEKFIANVLSHMNYPDMDIDVLTPYECRNDAFRQLIQMKGGQLYELHLEFRPGQSRRALLGPIKKVLSSHYYDVVHIHSGSISVLAYASLAAKMGKASKIMVHSHSTGISSLKHTVIRCAFGPMLSACATHFLACTVEAGMMKFPRAIVNRRLIVVQNGINIQDYARDDEKRKQYREKLGIPEECYVIGHVGRFTEEKNHAFLIDVFAKVHDLHSNSKLLLVGDGERMGQVKAKVDSLGLSDSVLYTGDVDNVQDYYQAMDVFVLPSHYEGFSFVALEAQAAGLPCLISEGVPEAVMVGKNIHRLRLEEDVWAQECIRLRGTKKTDNRDAIIRAGYDIGKTVEQIYRLYHN